MVSCLAEHTSARFWAAVDNLGYSTVLFIDGLIVMLPILLLPFMVPRKVASSGERMNWPMPEAS